VTPSPRSPPTWAEFNERPAAEFEPVSPAAELAAILQRFRDGLDQAGRAGVESRMRGLRALAEQAVLAVELERLLERQEPDAAGLSPSRARDGLRQLKDRMLAHIAACGLEVVRLRGARAGDVADLVEVACWRYDDVHEIPVVVQELEAAIRLDGVPLRRGRVVVGGRRDARLAAALGKGRDRQDERLPAAAGPAPVRPPPPRIVCPIAGCKAENHANVEACVGCLTPLGGYARLSMHREALFNRGLRAAQGGDSAGARECFAAIVLWHPHDIRTRNAHALACLDDSDVGAARRSWEEVLARAPGDSLALRGLAALPHVAATRDDGRSGPAVT
jgi:hypothetical protein